MCIQHFVIYVFFLEILKDFLELKYDRVGVLYEELPHVMVRLMKEQKEWAEDLLQQIREKDPLLMERLQIMHPDMFLCKATVDIINITLNNN